MAGVGGGGEKRTVADGGSAVVPTDSAKARGERRASTRWNREGSRAKPRPPTADRRPRPVDPGTLARAFVTAPAAPIVSHAPLNTTLESSSLTMADQDVATRAPESDAQEDTPQPAMTVRSPPRPESCH